MLQDQLFDFPLTADLLLLLSENLLTPGRFASSDEILIEEGLSGSSVVISKLILQEFSEVLLICFQRYLHYFANVE